MNKVSVPRENQITYALELKMKVPYEIYINDIKGGYDYIGANSAVELNPYVLEKGKVKIRIVILPIAGKNEISIQDLKESSVKFGYYYFDNKTGKVKDYSAENFNPLSLNIPTKPLPSYEQEWEVQADKIPYKLEGWRDGQDLSKMDKKQLEKKVKLFYEKSRVILNSGNFESWKKITAKRFAEFTVYKYLDEQDQLDYLALTKEDVEQYAKNTMIPLENYSMKIYADGKVVALEKNIHTKEYNNDDMLDIYSWSALISKGEVSGASDYPILLYLPQGSKEFVIIRK